LGGVLAAFYALKFGGVSHLVLIAPAGQKIRGLPQLARDLVLEPWKNMVISKTEDKLMDSTSLLTKSMRFLHGMEVLLSHTPDYHFPQDAPMKLRQRGVHVCIRQGIFDIFHYPALKWWLDCKGDEKVDLRQDSRSTSGRLVWSDHCIMCMFPQMCDIYAQEYWMEPTSKL